MKLCKYCAEVLSEDKKVNQFCNRSCSATFNNTGLTKKEREGAPPSISKDYRSQNRRKVCMNCSSPCYDKFCKRSCQHTFEKASFILRWKAGEEKGYRGKAKQISLYVRNYMLEKAQYRCTKCGWAELHELTGTVPVQVDHIDGDAENCTESNLQVLCPNCHSLTHTFAGLNRGKGKRKR